MSQPASPRQSFMQTLLWCMVIFLGLQLWMGSNKPAPDPRKPEEILTSMRDLNDRLMDIDIARTFMVYEGKIREEEKAGRLKEEEVKQRLLEANVLVADTEFKSGLQHNLYSKLDRAFNRVLGLRAAHRGETAWTQPVTVAPWGDRTQASITPDALYDDLAKELSARSRKELVLGFIPGYSMIDGLVRFTGSVPSFSYAFAGLLLAIVVRALVWPLAQKQFLWGRQMSQLNPYIKEIKEKFTDKKTGQVTDQQGFTQETMKLYKEYGFNPLSGCFPMLIQLPLFLIIYNCMLLYKFEFTQGRFLWIHPGATSFLGIPIAPNLGERDYILVGVYGLSMVVTAFLTPVSDPANARQQRLMSLGISVFFSIAMFFWQIPSAFVLYWIFTNVLATGQSLLAYSRPVPPLQKVATIKGGALPLEPGGEKNGHVDPGFFGKTGTPKTNKPKRKKP